MSFVSRTLSRPVSLFLCLSQSLFLSLALSFFHTLSFSQSRSLSHTAAKALDVSVVHPVVLRVSRNPFAGFRFFVLRIWVSVLEFWDFKFCAAYFRFRVSDFAVRISVLEFRIQDTTHVENGSGFYIGLGPSGRALSSAATAFIESVPAAGNFSCPWRGRV